MPERTKPSTSAHHTSQNMRKALISPSTTHIPPKGIRPAGSGTYDQLGWRRPCSTGRESTPRQAASTQTAIRSSNSAIATMA